MTRVLLAFLLSPLPLAAGAQTTPTERVERLTGTIRRHPGFQSRILGNARDVTVYLPPGYDREPRRRYPVLYMQDGQNLFSGKTSFLPNKEWRADETAEALIRAGLIEPIIIVAVDNAGAARADEYLPTKAPLPQGGAWGGKADLYGRMLVTELKPMVDRTYRTKPDPANTGIGGSSFGGILALHMALTRPETFGKILAMSPSLWWDSNLIRRRIDALPRKLDERIWLDIGTAEDAPTRSSAVVRDARDAAQALERKGWRPGRDLVLYVEPGAVHNEDAWAGRFDAALMFLFPARR